MTQHRTPRPINTQEAAVDKLQAEVQRLRDRIKELERRMKPSDYDPHDTKFQGCEE